MKRIELTQKMFSTVDNDDFLRLSEHKWCYANGYAIRNRYRHGKRCGTVWMHREILKPSKGFYIDHIDGNGLNNRKNNLRICTKAQNSRNSKIPSNSTTGFKGVVFNVKNNKFIAHIRFNYQRHHLGVFKTAKNAARAYNSAAKRFYGEFACLNKIY